MDLEDIYGAFYRDLLAYCQAMTKNRSDPEDLVQETYLRALTHWEDVGSLRRSQCRSWLYRTARNVYIDQLRKLSRETPEEDKLALVPFEEDLTRAAVLQLVGRLPDTERTLFSMRYFEGYNARELGELFDFPEPSYDEAVSMAARLLHEGAQNVLVSMGSEGAFLLTEGERLLTANAVLGPVVSTVGAGDALAAGFLAGLLFCGNKVQALAMGVAAGCAATRTSHLPQKQEIMSLLSKVQVIQPEA